MKSPYTDSLAHTTWECKYHIVFAPKFRRKEIYGKLKCKCQNKTDRKIQNKIDRILSVFLMQKS